MIRSCFLFDGELRMVLRGRPAQLRYTVIILIQVERRGVGVNYMGKLWPMRCGTLLILTRHYCSTVPGEDPCFDTCSNGFRMFEYPESFLV
jgi:hypothetical protein